MDECRTCVFLLLQRTCDLRGKHSQVQVWLAQLICTLMTPLMSFFYTYARMCVYMYMYLRVDLQICICFLCVCLDACTCVHMYVYIIFAMLHIYGGQSGDQLRNWNGLGICLCILTRFCYFQKIVLEFINPELSGGW